MGNSYSEQKKNIPTMAKKLINERLENKRLEANTLPIPKQYEILQKVNKLKQEYLKKPVRVW
jgi:hypothetical protein